MKNGKFVQKTWEDLIMKLLSNTLDQIVDEEMLCDVAKAFGKQIETLYPKLPDEKVSLTFILILKITIALNAFICY